MPRTLITQTPSLTGQTVTIAGQIDARRDMGKIVFLDLRDRSGLLQVVCNPRELGDAAAVAKDWRPGTILRITGPIKERGAKAVNPKLATGRIEMEAKEITVLATSQPFPFDATKEVGLDTYLDHLPFTLRTDRTRAIFKAQSEIVEAFRAFLRSQDFTEFQAPKLVGGATEGGANVFTVDYFDKKAFLAQSPQFYKQIMVGVFERVFTVGNVYRAELHAT
ncbi:aspartate--tRNA(Asn) ligase, partial [Candidatus Uhrbacteria bacterium]|nr:aspartate--tRNA(Asn) ligase [Candidatus Uhrbacteria bacterium]